MTRRRKLIAQYSKQLSSTSVSSQNNKQKTLSRRQRRRIRQHLRRKQRRMKRRIHSMSMTTQIAANALDMLHISTELDTKPLEFIDRYELTRQHALNMPLNQQPIVVFIQQENNHMFSSTTNKLYNSMEEDYYSSYV